MYVQLILKRDMMWNNSDRKLESITPYNAIPCGSTSKMRLDARKTLGALIIDSREFLIQSEGTGTFSGFIITRNIIDGISDALYTEVE